jgi:hypothetical protein
MNRRGQHKPVPVASRRNSKHAADPTSSLWARTSDSAHNAGPPTRRSIAPHNRNVERCPRTDSTTRRQSTSEGRRPRVVPAQQSVFAVRQPCRYAHAVVLEETHGPLAAPAPHLGWWTGSFPDRSSTCIGNRRRKTAAVGHYPPLQTIVEVSRATRLVVPRAQPFIAIGA